MENTTSDMSSSAVAGFTGSLLTKSNSVFCCYLFWSSLLILKMLLMSVLTARQRMKTKTFANPEDLRLSRTTEVRFNDPNVERMRR